MLMQRSEVHTLVTESMQNSNKMLLEKKDHMKKRGLESPDWADALALTFLVPGNESPHMADEDDFLATLRGSRGGNDFRDEHTGY